MSASTLQRRRAAATLATAALALGLLSSVGSPASADPSPPPVVSFIDTLGANGDGAALSTGAIDGSGPRTRLTSSAIQTFRYDVSDDGDTLLVAGVGGAVTADSSDVTYGLVLVRRSGASTTTTLLATDWYGNPVLSADGTKAYWLSKNNVYVSDGATTSVASATTAFAWNPAVEVPVGLAISPDGESAAVIYRGSGSQARLRAASLAAGITAPYVARSYTAAPTPSSATLLWSSATTVVFAEIAGSSITNRSATLVAGGNAVLTGSLPDFYDIAAFRGEFWMWKDSASTSDFGASSAALTAPVSVSPGLSVSDTYSYRLSEAAPPPLSATVAGRPAAHAVLLLGARSVAYGRQVPYASFNNYLKTVPGLSLDDDSYFVSRGALQASTNGSSWTTVATTSGITTFAANGSSANFWNGYTRKLTRNTWFRWVYVGDAFTQSGTSARSLVTVTPFITASVKKKGTKKIVSGKVTRVGGKIVLYKAGKKLATATISSSGAYKFTARRLAKGRYTLKVAADSSWSAGSKKLTV